MSNIQTWTVSLCNGTLCLCKHSYLHLFKVRQGSRLVYQKEPIMLILFWLGRFMHIQCLTYTLCTLILCSLIQHVNFLSMNPEFHREVAWLSPRPRHLRNVCPVTTVPSPAGVSYEHRRIVLKSQCIFGTFWLTAAAHGNEMLPGRKALQGHTSLTQKTPPPALSHRSHSWSVYWRIFKLTLILQLFK